MEIRLGLLARDRDLGVEVRRAELMGDVGELGTDVVASLGASQGEINADRLGGIDLCTGDSGRLTFAFERKGLDGAAAWTADDPPDRGMAWNAADASGSILIRAGDFGGRAIRAAVVEGRRCPTTDASPLDEALPRRPG